MLIRFCVENFLSFDEPTELSMVASAERIHPHHVLRTKSRSEPNLLRFAAIYGGNAAGKSNLIKAAIFLKNTAARTIKPDAQIPVKRFRLREQRSSDPTTMIVEFRYRNIFYRYRIEVEESRFIREELSSSKTGTAYSLLFDRRDLEGGVEVTFGTFSKKLPAEEQQFLDFVGKGTRRTQSFLRESYDRNIKHFHAPLEWFRKSLIIIEPGTEAAQLELQLNKDVNFKQYFGDILRTAGTGICGIETHEISFEEIEADVPKDLVTLIRDTVKDNEAVLVSSLEGGRFAITKSDDTIKALRFTTLHDGEDMRAAFEVEEESDGTKRMFDLVPMLYDLTVTEGERVYLVDEIGRSLHPHLSSLIVSAHLDPANADRFSQLIVTTHETNLLDLDAIRRDEIWFAEKQHSGSTDLYSLSEYQPRYDKDVRRDYLIGRYGAIPYLGNVHQLRLLPVRPDVDDMINATEPV